MRARMINPRDPVRRILRDMDHRMRADPDNLCDRCGKAIVGVQFVDGVVTRTRSGRYVGGTPQSRTEAGLCECP